MADWAASAVPGGRPGRSAEHPAAGPSRVRLIVTAGTARGQVIAVRAPVFTIGRDPSCQLRARGESISRRHASIVQREGRVFVRDHNSTNGTSLGDRWFRDEEVEARDGLLLRIRSLQFALAIDPLPDPNASTRLPDASPGEPAATRPPQIRLLVSSGSATGQVIDIHESRFTIGRDPSCRLRINSFLVSRQHAAIARRDGRVFVRDLGSRQGTLLNDRLLCDGELEVRDGDSLQVGDLVFRLALSSAAGDEPATLSSPAARHASPRRGASRASRRRSESWIQCPDCGNEGWVPLERLLEKLVEVIRRTMPQSVAPPVRTPASAPAAAAARRVIRPGRNLDVSTFDLPAYGRPPEAPAPPPLVSDDRRGRSGIAPEPLTIETFDVEGLDPLSHAELPTVADETTDLPVELDLSEFELPRIALHEPDRPATVAAAEPPLRQPKPQPAVVTITCPNPGCQASGAAARERIDEQMRCKVCGTDFYRDPATDQLVIGAHPDPQTKAKARPRPAATARGARIASDGARKPDIEDTFRNWSRALRRNRFMIRLGAAAIFVVALLWYGSTSLFSSPSDLPNQVHVRAIYVARALAQNAPARVRALAVRSTRGDADRWFQKIRPGSWPSSDEGVVIRFWPDYVRIKGGTAATRVEVDRPGAGSKAGRDTIRFRLYWVMSGEGQWRLDGSKTLDRAQSPVPPIEPITEKKAAPQPPPAPGPRKDAPRKVAEPDPPPGERESEGGTLASACPHRDLRTGLSRSALTGKKPWEWTMETNDGRLAHLENAHEDLRQELVRPAVRGR